MHLDLGPVLLLAQHKELFDGEPSSVETGPFEGGERSFGVEFLALVQEPAEQLPTHNELMLRSGDCMDWRERWRRNGGVQSGERTKGT